MTIIAIPPMSDTGLESDVCAHCGSCEHFNIVDVCDITTPGIKPLLELGR